MPWPQRDVQLAILILCVPLQYLITDLFDNVKESDRSQIVMNTMKSIESFKNAVLNSTFWSLYWQNVFLVDTVESNVEEGEGDETTKQEPSDEKYQKDFDLRKLTRVHVYRSSDLSYRIGQVVQLTESAFRGVIIGWEVENEDTGQPVYTILVDESHSKRGMISISMEVEQDSLYVIRNREIKHRSLKWYFSAFDGSQYIPRDWLRKLYPKD